MFLDDFSPEAPLIDVDTAAEQTDVYAFFDPIPADAGATKDSFELTVVQAAEDQAREIGDSASTEDVFVFLNGYFARGDGSVVPESSTPVPEEEEPKPPEFGWKYELDNIGSARHTATGAMLLRWLVYG